MTRAALLLVAVTAVAQAGPRQDEPPRRPQPIEQRRTVGILDVRVDGVPDDVRAQFERALEHQLGTERYWISTRAQMRERMKFSTKWTEGCVVGPCLADVKVQTSAELVLLAALSGSGTSFGFALTLIRTDNGKVVVQEASRCDVCTVNEAMTAATSTMKRLLEGLPAKLPDPGEDQGVARSSAVAPVQVRLAAARHRRKRLGVTMAVVGLAAAGAGIAAFYGADWPRTGRTLAGVGAGLTLGGVAVLTF